MKKILKGIKKSFQSRQFRSGAYSTMISVLVIVVVVIINLMFSKLELSTDLSKGSLFTISKETKKIINKNKTDITLNYMVAEGKENDYIYNGLKAYAKLSKHITIKKVDPVSNPSFGTKYEISEDIGSNDVIVVNEKTKSAKYVAGASMYYTQQDYASYGSSQSSEYYLDVEGQITSAVQSVLAKNSTKMYLVKGHDELELGQTMNSSLEKINVETQELDLLTADKIPSDCNILYINGPVKDFTDNEKDIVLDYLKAGGDAIINLQYTDSDMKNLRKILEYYGMKQQNGVICETSGNYYYYPNQIVPQYEDGASVFLESTDAHCIMLNAVGLNVSSEIRSSLKMQPLMSSSSGSYLKVDPSSGSAEKENGDIDGPFTVSIVATESVSANKDKKDGSEETKLVVNASASAFEETYMSTDQVANGEVIKTAIGSMVVDDTPKVAIDAKSMSFSYITVKPVSTLIWAAVMIIILPLTCLAVGFVVWFTRRRR